MPFQYFIKSSYFYEGFDNTGNFISYSNTKMPIFSETAFPFIIANIHKLQSMDILDLHESPINTIIENIDNTDIIKFNERGIANIANLSCFDESTTNMICQLIFPGGAYNVFFRGLNLDVLHGIIIYFPFDGSVCNDYLGIVDHRDIDKLAFLLEQRKYNEYYFTFGHDAQDLIIFGSDRLMKELFNRYGTQGI